MRETTGSAAKFVSSGATQFALIWVVKFQFVICASRYVA
jgi:hypothetical protein